MRTCCASVAGCAGSKTSFNQQSSIHDAALCISNVRFELLTISIFIVRNLQSSDEDLTLINVDLRSDMSCPLGSTQNLDGYPVANLLTASTPGVALPSFHYLFYCASKLNYSISSSWNSGLQIATDCHGVGSDFRTRIQLPLPPNSLRSIESVFRLKCDAENEASPVRCAVTDDACHFRILPVVNVRLRSRR